MKTKSKLVLVVIIPSVFLMALLTFALYRPAPAQAAGFLVVGPADDALAHDVNPGDGICLDGGGACTLRAAIEEANALDGADTITFAYAMTITIDSTVGALPAITSPLTIDASSEWDTANDRPGVVLEGNNQILDGLFLQTDANQIYGLYITGFNHNGIYIPSGNNKIGGIAPSQRNIISGNGFSGIILQGSSAKNNQIANNYMGTTPDGMAKHPNGIGIVISDFSTFNVIGGDGESYRNVISGNTDYGVYISGMLAENNQVSANYIGSTVDGSTPLSNGKAGILIDLLADNNIIGGSPMSGNLIAGNDGAGIEVQNANAISIEYNAIIANKGEGILLTNRNARVFRNTIAINARNGIVISGTIATGNELSENSITNNTLKGIVLSGNANGGINPPVITAVLPHSVSGTACGLCKIEIFSDDENEGEIFEGTTTADANGDWSYSGSFSGPKLTATARDDDHNTSEFSTPTAVVYQLFLPAILKP